MNATGKLEREETKRGGSTPGDVLLCFCGCQGGRGWKQEGPVSLALSDWHVKWTNSFNLLGHQSENSKKKEQRDAKRDVACQPLSSKGAARTFSPIDCVIVYVIHVALDSAARNAQ